VKHTTGFGYVADFDINKRRDIDLTILAAAPTNNRAAALQRQTVIASCGNSFKILAGRPNHRSLNRTPAYNRPVSSQSYTMFAARSNGNIVSFGNIKLTCFITAPGNN
jgi:hypothetical protein